MIRLPAVFQARLEDLKKKDREYWDDELYSPEALANWDYRAAVEQLIAGEKIVEKTALLEPEEIECAQNALGYLLSFDAYTDEDAVTSILGGSCDADLASDVIQKAYDLGWDGEALKLVRAPELSKQLQKAAESLQEEIPFLEESTNSQPIALETEKSLEPEPTAFEEKQLQLPAVVEKEPVEEVTTVIRGEDGIYIDADTGEVLMSTEEVLALLRVEKPKFEIVDLDTAHQYIEWVCELQEKATRYTGQMIAMVSDVVTALNSISYYFSPALKSVIDPQLKRKKNKDTGEITISPKNYKGPTGSVFFTKKGGAEIFDERQVKEFVESLNKEQLPFYGVSIEITRKWSKTKIKELVAAGTQIPGTRVVPQDQLGVMRIGPAGPRTGWSPGKLKELFKPFNKKLKALKYIEHGKTSVVKVERLEEEDEEDDFE